MSHFLFSLMHLRAHILIKEILHTYAIAKKRENIYIIQYKSGTRCAGEGGEHMDMVCWCVGMSALGMLVLVHWGGQVACWHTGILVHVGVLACRHTLA